MKRLVFRQYTSFPTHFTVNHLCTKRKRTLNVLQVLSRKLNRLGAPVLQTIFTCRKPQLYLPKHVKMDLKRRFENFLKTGLKFKICRYFSCQLLNSPQLRFVDVFISTHFFYNKCIHLMPCRVICLLTNCIKS